jgi:AcrR family transcriptional regulator
MRKGEATRLRVLETAARQAAARGLEAVSLGELADAVGLSKSGLFKHFECKEAMQLAVVRLVAERFCDFIFEEAAAVPAGRPRMEHLFQRWLDWSDSEWTECGCPVNAFTAELDDRPGPLRELLREKLMAFRQAMIAEMRQVRDPPLSEAEAQAAYFQMRSFMLGHGDARRMMGDADARRSALAAFAALLDRTAKSAA